MEPKKSDIPGYVQEYMNESIAKFADKLKEKSNTPGFTGLKQQLSEINKNKKTSS